MSLFRKKKEIPAVIYSLNECLKNAREKQEASFYYPLWEHEVDIARAWALQKHMMVEPDHKTDNNIFYKFWGYK